MEENREINIDLRKIFAMLKKKLVFIVLISLVGAAIAGCFTNFFIEPKYTASVKLHVYSSNDNRVASNSTITSSEFDASEKLVNTYLVVVESNTFTQKVADKVGGGITRGQIRSMMSCSKIEETVAFQVNVTSTDPEQAKNVANAIAETCPEEIVRILKVGGVEVIDYASKPEKPSSPNLKKNALIGLVAGFVLSFAFFFIKELFDTSVHDENDLQREFDIPILGTIPRLVPVTERTASNAKTNLEPPTPAIDFSTTGKEDALNESSK